MIMTKPQDVPEGRYDATAKYIALDTLRMQQKQEIIRRAMESRAIRTLEAIRWVLENDQFDDPECFERVDALVMTFFQELEINVNRHNELD